MLKSASDVNQTKISKVDAFIRLRLQYFTTRENVEEDELSLTGNTN